MGLGGTALVAFAISGFLESTPIPLPTPSPPTPGRTRPTPAETVTPIPVGGAGETRARPMDGMGMVFVPEGVFTMGMDGEDRLGASYEECKKV